MFWNFGIYIIPKGDYKGITRPVKGLRKYNRDLKPSGQGRIKGLDLDVGIYHVSRNSKILY